MEPEARAEEFSVRGPRPRPRVLVVGPVTRDVVHRHGRRSAQIGGTVWFAGTTLAGLGVEVRVLTRLAPADRAIAGAMTDAGLAVEALASPVTTEFHNIYGPGGRDDRTQQVGALAAPIAAAELAPWLDAVDVVYLGPLHPDDIAAPALALLWARDRPHLAMDVQGFTRHVRDGVVGARVAPVLPELLRRARVVKASRHEARLITGEASDEAAARALAAMAGTAEVLVTCGPEGALLAYGGNCCRQAAVALDDLDPTGAGDIFLASYLASRLGGEVATEALAFAVAHAARRLADPARIVPLDD